MIIQFWGMLVVLFLAVLSAPPDGGRPQTGEESREIEEASFLTRTADVSMSVFVGLERVSIEFLHTCDTSQSVLGANMSK